MALNVTAGYCRTLSETDVGTVVKPPPPLPVKSAGNLLPTINDTFDYGHWMRPSTRLGSCTRATQQCNSADSGAGSVHAVENPELVEELLLGVSGRVEVDVIGAE